MSQMEPFVTPLGRDPAVALPPPQRADPLRKGPLPKVQYVIELVGPRSVPASSACHLLDVNWYQALGKPETWCMGAVDEEWRPLTGTTDGAYDSLALAWNLLEPPLNEHLARGLLGRAEEFAGHIQRRAMPMPVPEEVEKQVRTLRSIRDNLDIGFSLAFGPSSGAVAEKDLWIECSRLGLTFGPSGAFEWKAETNELPLLSVTPIGGTETFSLAAVQRGDVHEGATIGFSFPLCPSPAEALEGCILVGRHLCQTIGGALFDEEGDPLGAATLLRLRGELAQGERLFTQVGIQPGSSEAAKIWR